MSARGRIISLASWQGFAPPTSALAAGLLAAALPLALPAATWRVGDADQPWRLHPVSFVAVTGETFTPEYTWGGSHAAEVVVDDDGDGLVDEDPVDRVDDDGDLMWNEDPLDGRDNDYDGAADEDGPDPQQDNDGDGLVNEDGTHTGGPIYQPGLRVGYQGTPFFRYATAEEAAADAGRRGTGYGWGDDDADSRFNEDPIDGADNDGDGLIDEDGAAPEAALPESWSRPVFAYDAPDLDTQGRRDLRFGPPPAGAGGAPVLVATDPAGRAVEARLVRPSFRPTDWLRPIRLDATRNVSRLADDRFLAGLFGEQDPFQLGSQVGTPRVGDSGNGQVVDGSIATAKSVVGNWGLGTDLRGLFWIDRVRYYPRPNFPDRTPASFAVYFGGDDPSDFRLTPLGTELLANRFLVPLQTDQLRPVIKDFRLDPAERVRVVSMGSRVREGDTWELAESELYGIGYALGASYFTEIIDVGTPTPRYRRYFDPAEPQRPVPFESIRTADANNDGRIGTEELARTQAERQFDDGAPGQPVTWGAVRWHGTREGDEGGVEVRVRAGTGLDTRIYHRRVGRGVTSPFVEAPILLDWPPPGSRLDAYSYVALPSVARAPFRDLPANHFGEQDGVGGGWTPWSAPIDFDEGLVARDGGGGVRLAVPPLTRYIQFRFDFESTDASGISLDYLELDFSRPLVSGGLVAEIYPDTAAVLGQPAAFEYVLQPRFTSGGRDAFDRIDIAVPSVMAGVDSLLLDGRRWESVAAGGGDPEATGSWLDSLTVGADGVFASGTYFDAAGVLRLGIKTRHLVAADFPPGQGRDLRVFFHTAVYALMTRFESRVWDGDDPAALPQATTAGNAADELPADGVAVIAPQGGRTLGQVAARPNPFSPNGDGINDETELGFDLLLLLEATQVRAEIYTLAGRRVRQARPVERAIGRHALVWDGRDDAGRVVPPGLYLYRLAAEAGEGEVRGGVVAVAY